MDAVVKYIDGLLEKSTPDAPVWNIEKIRQGLKSKWNYIDGCMIKAVLQMYDLTKEEKYLKFADDFIDYRVFEDGTIDGYSIGEKNIDNVNAGKTLFELYDLTGKEKYKKAVDLVYSQIEIMPRCQNEARSFWHKDIYPNQVWLDGLYMGLPFYLEYETRYNDRKNYSDIFGQFKFVIENMRNPINGLYFHAMDTSREAFWCDKVTGLSQHSWLRAIGWYTMALIDTLDQVDNKDHKYDAECKMLEDAFKDLVDSMLKYQDESGMWYQVVNYGGMIRTILRQAEVQLWHMHFLRLYVLDIFLMITHSMPRKQLMVSVKDTLRLRKMVHYHSVVSVLLQDLVVMEEDLVHMIIICQSQS